MREVCDKKKNCIENQISSVLVNIYYVFENVDTFKLLLHALNFWQVPSICIFSAFAERKGVLGVIGFRKGELPSAEFGFALESIGDRASRRGLSSVYFFSTSNGLSRIDAHKSKEKNEVSKFFYQ